MGVHLKVVFISKASSSNLKIKKGKKDIDKNSTMKLLQIKKWFYCF